MAKVHFLREGISVEVPPNTTIRQAASKVRILLYTGVFRFINCHGLGFCGECRVRVVKGWENLSLPTAQEKQFKRPSKERHKGVRGIYEDEFERLPCQARVQGEVEVLTRLREEWQ